MTLTDNPSFEHLKQFLSDYKIVLQPKEYPRVGNQLLCAEPPIGSCMESIKSRDYGQFMGKELKTTFLEMPGEGSAEIYLNFNCGADSSLIAQIARIFPGKRKNFHGQLLENAVLHLMSLAEKGVNKNTVIIPEILVCHARRYISHAATMEAKLDKYYREPVSAIICDEASAKDKNLVFDSLRITDNSAQ